MNQAERRFDHKEKITVTTPSRPAHGLLGALAVLLVVALCAGVPGVYLMHSAVTSYGMLESGGQSRLARCEDRVFANCDRAVGKRG